MNFGKRQLILGALVIALGASVYINWQFTDNQDLLATNTVTSTKELGKATYVNNEVMADKALSESVPNNANLNSKTASEYFTQTRSNRQKAREEEVDTLKEILEGAKSSEQAKTEAITQATVIAQNIEQETNVENLIKAKGFIECVSFIQNGECSVVVSSPNGLLESEAITIRDVVCGQTGITYDKIKIIEAK